MSKNKSTTLYPHPFSKAYWRDAVAELKDLRILIFAALMIALRVLMKQVAIPIAMDLKINTAFFQSFERTHCIMINLIVHQNT